jgi:hypothetical protein
MSQPGTTIRSFRVVFELERRIHRIDRWRIPVPYGVPLRGVGYALAALAGVLALQKVPVAGEPLRLLAPPLRLVILPIGVAYLLSRLRIDGRPAHRFVFAWLDYVAGPKFISSFRRAPAPGSLDWVSEVTLAADGRAARPRAGVVEGPARILVRYPARARARRRVLELRTLPGGPMLQGKVVELRAGQRLEVRA